MKILEIIHLRMAGDDAGPLAEFALGVADEGAGSPEVRIYRHAQVEGDLLVQLKHEAAEDRIEPCELGVRLASVLRVHGMVVHSVWVGCEGRNHSTEDPGRRGTTSKP